jgi:uncharacterized protein YukE
VGLLEAAAPAEQWAGRSAIAYEVRYAELAQVLARLADLDGQLAAEIDQSANVVASGRAELDNVRDWVVSAASSVPDTPAGEVLLMSIVSKGMADLGDVLATSNDELNTIGTNIRQIGAEYSALAARNR